MIWIRAYEDGSINLVSVIERNDCVEVETELTPDDLISGKYLLVDGQIIDNPDYEEPNMELLFNL